MNTQDSGRQRERILACLAFYWFGVTIWWLLVVLDLAGGGAWLWTPLRELIFGQAVLLEHFMSIRLPRIVAPVIWLVIELAAATGVAFLVERRLKKARGPCWLRALIAVGVLQAGLYGLGVLVGE